VCQVRTPFDETAHETLALHRCLRAFANGNALDRRQEFLMKPVEIGIARLPVPQVRQRLPLAAKVEVPAPELRRDSEVFQRLS
jgi:hypothetical protein